MSTHPTKAKYLTVGTLRKKLEKLPANMPVFVREYIFDHQKYYHTLLSAVETSLMFQLRFPSGVKSSYVSQKNDLVELYGERTCIESTLVEVPAVVLD